MTNRKVLVYVAIMLLLSVGLSIAASTYTVPQSGTVSYGVSDGPSVSVTGDINTTGVWTDPTDANTVQLETSAGNLTVSSQGVTDFTVDSQYLDNSQWFNITSITAGSTWIEVTPEDKNQFDVRGDTNALSVRDTIALDDGVVDFYISGTDSGLGSVRVRGLPANTQVGAIDANTYSLLDGGTTDNNGVLELDIPLSDHNVLLTDASDSQASVVDSASPTGQIIDPANTISFDLSDGDFPRDNVDVTVDFEGSEIYSETAITSNKSISTSNFTANELGKTYSWTVEATDVYGETTTESYSFTLPNQLYVYNETNSSELVDNVSVDATITGSDETVNLQRESDGVFDLSGLPANESYVFTLSAENYHTKEVYIMDIFEQATVFMLNTNESSVNNQITITDRTGEYGRDTVILVDRVINTTSIGNMTDEGSQWVAIGGDRLGAGGFYPIDLEEDGRYRFRVTNDKGDTRVLSEYTAKVSGEINLQIGSITYSIGDAETHEWDVSATNLTSGGHQIRVAYNDNTNLTENVSVAVESRDGTTTFDSQDFTGGPYGEVVFTTEVTQDQWENNTFAGQWSAKRDGEVISGQRLVAGKGILDFGPLSDIWKSIAYGASMLVLAFLVGAGAGVAPALVTLGMASGFAVYIGLAPPALAFGPTILVVALGAIYMLNST